MEKITRYETVALDEETKELVLLDQTKLPNEAVLVRHTRLKTIWDAIHTLQVRGAPAIGVAAALGFYVVAYHISAKDKGEWLKKVQAAGKYLNTARPTAVNLSWAIERMTSCLSAHQHEDKEAILEALHEEALTIKNEDTAVCEKIGEYGLSLIKDGDGILTHCNAGELATSRYGTALSPIYLGIQKGMHFKVYADETRPLLQGARLTAYELMAAGVDTTLICDNMASVVMKNGWVQAIFVGCDRLAANGDVANKIGTNTVAILAQHYHIPFYVCTPLSTIDWQCETGDDIVIEERKKEEVTTLWYEKPMAPEGVKVYNPAFDVTNHSLVTAIVTEKGIIFAPDAEKMTAFRREIERGE